MDAINQTVMNYWSAFYAAPNGLCSLCGNSGIVHTEAVRSPAGVHCGRKNYCFCPNGQHMRKNNRGKTDA